LATTSPNLSEAHLRATLKRTISASTRFRRFLRTVRLFLPVAYGWNFAPAYQSIGLEKLHIFIEIWYRGNLLLLLLQYIDFIRELGHARVRKPGQPYLVLLSDCQLTAAAALRCSIYKNANYMPYMPTCGKIRISRIFIFERDCSTYYPYVAHIARLVGCATSVINVRAIGSSGPLLRGMRVCTRIYTHTYVRMYTASIHNAT
jgi:hypothetical protein